MDEAVLGLTAKVVSAYLTNNRLPGDQLPELIRAVYKSLSTADSSTTATDVAKPAPMVEVRKSVFPDRLICLACGQPFSMLKRHLHTEHQLTPDEYRERYSLPRSYPIVAPDYARVRSALAKKIGLGRTAVSRGPKRMAGRKRR